MIASEVAKLKPFSFYLKQRKIQTNLPIMVMVWLTSAFCYYLVLTLINSFDKVYVAGIISSVSELIAYVTSACLFSCLGVKKSLITCFLLSAISGVAIIAWGLQHQDTVVFFLVFMFAKFGVSCTFNIEYIVMNRCFPTLFVASAMGICNFLATIASGSSYLIGQMPQPTPMYLFTGLCSLTSFCVLFLQVRPEAKKRETPPDSPEGFEEAVKSMVVQDPQ